MTGKRNRKFLKTNGAPGRIRTCDLRFRRTGSAVCKPHPGGVGVRPIKLTVSMILTMLSGHGLDITADEIRLTKPTVIEYASRAPGGHPGTPLAVLRVGLPEDGMGSAVNLGARAAVVDPRAGDFR